MQMLLHWIKANPAEGIFFPLSFHHFSRHQNSFTFLQGIGDVTSFYTAYFGSQVALGRIGSASAFSRAVQMGKKIPAAGPIKAIVPLVAGAVAAAATEIGFQTLSAQRAKWNYLSGNKVGSLYTDGTTYEGQALNMLVPETLDMVNRVGSWLAKKTGIPSDDIDIGIPEISLKTPFGYLGTIPEITLFESTVNMGTNPWEWVR